MLKLALVVLLGVTLVKGQSFHNGPCTSAHWNANYLHPFNWTRFAGKWYVRERIPTLFDATAKCIVNNYVNLTNGNSSYQTSHVTLNWRHYDAITQFLTDINMPFNISYPYESAGGGHTVNNFPLLWMKFNLNVNILYTDYDNVALAFGCMDWWVFHYDFVWVKTRQRNLQQTSLLDPLYAKMKDHGLDRSTLRGVDTFFCPDY